MKTVFGRIPPSSDPRYKAPYDPNEENQFRADIERAFLKIPVASSGGNTPTPATVFGIASPLPLLWLSRESLLAQRNGLAIYGWLDSGPYGWNMVPDTPSVGPAWDSTTLGGSVTFAHSTSDAVKHTAFFGLDYSTSFTLVWVGQHRGSGGLLTNTSAFIYGYTTSGLFEFTDSGLAWRAKHSFTPAAANHYFTLVYDGNGTGNAGKVQMYVDGVAQTLTFDGTVASSMPAGTGLIVGDGVGVGYADCSATDVLIFPGALAAPALATLHAAIAAKYSI